MFRAPKSVLTRQPRRSCWIFVKDQHEAERNTRYKIITLDKSCLVDVQLVFFDILWWPNEKVGAGPLGHVPGDDVDFEKQAWKMLRYMHVSFGATSWLEQSESSQNPCRKFRKLLPERVVCWFLLVYSLGITRTLVLWFLWTVSMVIWSVWPPRSLKKFSLTNSY